MDGNSPCFNHKDSGDDEYSANEGCPNGDDLDFADATPLRLPQ